MVSFFILLYFLKQLEQFLSFTTEDDETAFTERNLKPLNTYGLRPYKYSTKSGILEIHKDGVVSLEVLNIKRKLVITPDGLKVNFDLLKANLSR